MPRHAISVELSKAIMDSLQDQYPAVSGMSFEQMMPHLNLVTSIAPISNRGGEILRYVAEMTDAQSTSFTVFQRAYNAKHAELRHRSVIRQAALRASAHPTSTGDSPRMLATMHPISVVEPPNSPQIGAVSAESTPRPPANSPSPTRIGAASSSSGTQFGAPHAESGASPLLDDANQDSGLFVDPPSPNHSSMKFFAGDSVGVAAGVEHAPAGDGVSDAGGQDAPVSEALIPSGLLLPQEIIPGAPHPSPSGVSSISGESVLLPWVDPPTTPAQGAIAPPTTPVQAAIAPSTPVHIPENTRRAYEKLAEKGANSTVVASQKTLQSVRAILNDYTKENLIVAAPIARFFTGHWNRNAQQLSKVAAIVRQIDARRLTTVECVMEELSKMNLSDPAKLDNPRGSLARRMQFIKELTGAPHTQASIAVVRTHGS